MFIVIEIQTSATVATGAVMLTDEGERLKNECYLHLPVPTPKPEEENNGDI